MHKGEEAGARLRDHPVPKASKGMPSRIAGGDACGGGGEGDQLIGRQPNPGDEWIVVGMEVDEARGDQLTGCINALYRPIRGNGGSDGRDLSILDPNIPWSSEVLAGIEHVAPGDQEIERERRVGRVEATRHRASCRADQDWLR